MQSESPHILCSTWKFADFISNIDNELRNTLEDILNIHFEEKQLIQENLPITSSALSVRHIEYINLPPLFVSAFGTKSFVANNLNSSGNKAETR